MSNNYKLKTKVGGAHGDSNIGSRLRNGLLGMGMGASLGFLVGTVIGSSYEGPDEDDATLISRIFSTTLGAGIGALVGSLLSDDPD